MTPKEKSISLMGNIEDVLQEYETDCSDWDEMVNKLMLICINELIAHSINISMVYDLTFDESSSYFTQVKKETQRL
jgi:hypothetical protein